MKNVSSLANSLVEKLSIEKCKTISWDEARDFVDTHQSNLDCMELDIATDCLFTRIKAKAEGQA